MKFDFLSYKKALLILGLMLCIIPQSVLAQNEKPKNLLMYDEKPYHFGFIVAINTMTFDMNYIDDYQFVEHDGSEYPHYPENPNTDMNSYFARSVEPTLQGGFSVGVVGNLRLAKYFDLRLIPTLSFNNRRINYQFYSDEIQNDDKNFEHSRQIFSTIMEFPLLVKYRSKRLNNIAAYMIAGANPKIDLSKRRENSFHLTRFDLAAEVGAGFDFYTGYFKMGVEIKMGFGLLNVLKKQDNLYDSSIESMNNRVVQMSLTFE